ncbi:unnamed protein product [Acanthosepion pharaonis]|uniref:Uncharacterized protein n=1 Tax=Acanthosepion pharaonis TaxID=158019 RepID=A0A812B051_ACAPH|nr:unnamed protein product [Sepia pharaonis]
MEGVHEQRIHGPIYYNFKQRFSSRQKSVTVEYEQRAAVVASFRTGKKPAEMMAWTDELVAAVKETIDNDGSQSYAKIAADMGCHKSTICLTIKKDIGYSSYRKSHRMLITNASKESRKIKAAALLNELKHGSARMLRFFSDEKNFIQDQTSNRQNDSWISKDIEKVPVVKHTNEWDVMPPFFFQKDLRITAEIYQEMLRSVVKSWMPLHLPARPGRGCSTMFLTTGRRTCGRPRHPTVTPFTISSGA